MAEKKAERKYTANYKVLDIILFKPTKWNIFGQIVSWVTNSPYCHIGIALTDDLLIEALSTVKVSSIYKRGKAGTVFRYTQEITPSQIKMAQNYLTNLIARRYDVGNLFDILINMARALIGRHSRPYFQKDDRPICSELVARAYHAAGIDLFPDKPLWAVTPADFAENKYFKREVMP